MDRLWAPWRKKYIQSAKKSRCIFCDAIKIPRKNRYVVFRTPHSLCMLNIYPYNNGHLMAAPRRHTGELEDLRDAEILDLMKTVILAKKLLAKVLKPHGYNIGINYAEVAGAGIPDHVHIHIVPRWRGDTNFMPILAGTKVISQSLEELYRQLKMAYKTNIADWK